MIYTRPSIWKEFNRDGMSDFICTDSVQYFVRNGSLIADVRMRSNDVVFGYKNDKAWQDHVHQKLASDLGIPVGPMIWHAGSLHVYERHWHLVNA
jgi:thymidylate synthase